MRVKMWQVNTNESFKRSGLKRKKGGGIKNIMRQNESMFTSSRIEHFTRGRMTVKSWESKNTWWNKILNEIDKNKIRKSGIKKEAGMHLPLGQKERKRRAAVLGGELKWFMVEDLCLYSAVGGQVIFWGWGWVGRRVSLKRADKGL